MQIDLHFAPRNYAGNPTRSRQDSSPTFHTTDTNRRAAPPLQKLKKSLCPSAHSPRPNDKIQILKYNYPPKWNESGLETSIPAMLRSADSQAALQDLSTSQSIRQRMPP